jgi:flagella basal body P-ring formation protein FlgA
VRVSCKSPSWGFYLPVTVSADVPVVVAKEYILKGEVFTENNIEEVFLPHTTYRKGMVESIHEILGKEARRNISNKEYMNHKMATPPVLVRKGSVINIIYKSKGLNLRTIGVSTENGRLGDSIKVLNKASNKAVWGKVLKENEVEVN